MPNIRVGIPILWVDYLSRSPIESNFIHIMRVEPNWIQELPPLYMKCSYFTQTYEKFQGQEMVVNKK